MKAKEKIIGETVGNGALNIGIMVADKYLSNFLRTGETPQIGFEISFMLPWSPNCVIPSYPVSNQLTTFTITGTELYVPARRLSD